MASRGGASRSSSGGRDADDGWQTASPSHGRGGGSKGRGGRGGARGGGAQSASPTGAGSQKNWRENSNSRLPSALLQQAQVQATQAEGGAEGGAAPATLENLPPRLGVVRSNEEGTIRIVNTFEVFRDAESTLQKGDIVDLNTRTKVDLPFEAEGWDSAGCIALSMEKPGVWGVFLLQAKCTEDFLAWYYPVLKNVAALPELAEDAVHKWALEEVRAVAEWSFPMFSAAQAGNMAATPDDVKDKYRTVARAVLAKAEAGGEVADALEVNAEARFWDLIGGRVKKCRCRVPHSSNAHCTALLHFDNEMEPFPDSTCEMLDPFTFDIHDHGIANVKRFSLLCIPLSVDPSNKDKVKPTAVGDFHQLQWFSLNDLAEGKEALQFRPREVFSAADSKRFFAELLAHIEALHGRVVAAAEEEAERTRAAARADEEEEEEDDILSRMMKLGKPTAGASESSKRN